MRVRARRGKMSGVKEPLRLPALSFAFSAILLTVLGATAVPGAPGGIPAATPVAPAAASAPPTAAAGAPSPASTSGIESAVRWMPQGAQLVVRLRFSDMRTCALFRTLMTSKPLFAAELAPVERFASEAGLDLGRDLDLGWIGTDGREGGASVAVLSGRLDGGTLGPRLEKRGARVTPYSEVPVYALPGRATAGGGAAETVVAFPRPGIALVGSRGWVSGAIDRVQGRGAGAAASPLLPLVGRADARATIWSAAAGRAVSEKIRTGWSSGQLGGEDFAAIQTLVATFRIAADLAIDSEAKAAGEDADALALTLKGLIAVSGLRASVTDPSLAGVLRETRVDRTDGGVRVTTRIPASFVSRL